MRKEKMSLILLRIGWHNRLLEWNNTVGGDAQPQSHLHEHHQRRFF